VPTPEAYEIEASRRLFRLYPEVHEMRPPPDVETA